MKDNIGTKFQNQKKQFVCPRLSARIITIDMCMLRLINVSQFPRRMRTSLTSPTECTRAKTASIFLLEKTAPGVIQSKSAPDMLIIMVNVICETLVKSIIMKLQKETNVYFPGCAMAGLCFRLIKTLTTNSAFPSINAWKRTDTYSTMGTMIGV